VVCGGVACNGLLRERFERKTPKGIKLCLSPREYCTDNAAMIGGVGWHHFVRGDIAPLDIDSFARLPVISRVPFCGDNV
jgi:N6-L-threonylcarbamoyladenine synthase